MINVSFPILLFLFMRGYAPERMRKIGIGVTASNVVHAVKFFAAVGTARD
jgi:hypothetical protein